MTHIFQPLPHEKEKWRQQAAKAAAHLKKTSLTKESLKLAFAFDDGLITVEIGATQIRELDETALAKKLFEMVLVAAQTEGNA